MLIDVRWQRATRTDILNTAITITKQCSAV
jgi:hypothetical protein